MPNISYKAKASFCLVLSGVLFFIASVILAELQDRTIFDKMLDKRTPLEFFIGSLLIPLVSFVLAFILFYLSIWYYGKNREARFFSEPYDTTSGTGNLALVPKEIDTWSWGAVLMGPFWGMFHGIPLSLISLIPVIGTVIWIIVGGKNGNKWAWAKRRYKNVETYKRSQKPFIVIGALFLAYSLFNGYGSFQNYIKQKEVEKAAIQREVERVAQVNETVERLKAEREQKRLDAEKVMLEQAQPSVDDLNSLPALFPDGTVNVMKFTAQEGVAYFKEITLINNYPTLNGEKNITIKYPQDWFIDILSESGINFQLDTQPLDVNAPSMGGPASPLAIYVIRNQDSINALNPDSFSTTPITPSQEVIAGIKFDKYDYYDNSRYFEGESAGRVIVYQSTILPFNNTPYVIYIQYIEKLAHGKMTAEDVVKVVNSIQFEQVR